MNHSVKLINEEKERVLTKRHKFTYEIKYRQLFAKIRGHNNVSFDKELDLELLDYISAWNIMYEATYDLDKVFEFLSDYKDVINVEECLYMGHHFFIRHVEKYVEIFDGYLSSKCWIVISKHIEASKHQEFLVKYKDKIRWDLVKYDHADFSIDTILKLEDYIEFDEELFNSEFEKQMLKYTIDHLEEVLTYKRNDTE